MRIFVTGAAGFIGMHLSLKLTSSGHEVLGIDNFNDYYPVALKEARFERLNAIPGFYGQQLDITDAHALDAAVRNFRPDVVCNLAAQAGVRYSIENPGVYVQSNLVGFANVLETCRRNNVPKLVYASSSSVYGGNTKLPFSESDSVDRPVSLYAATKKANELMAHTYSHLFGFQTIGLRFFTVYGPWGRPDMAMWLFTKAMLAGNPIKVFNHGNMRRDFTYIDDIVAGVVACIESSNLDKYEVLNIGHNHPENLLEIIQLLGKTLKVDPKMEMLPMQPGDVPATYADISRISEKLGYKPKTPVSIGIPNFVKWYKEYHKL